MKLTFPAISLSLFPRLSSLSLLATPGLCLAQASLAPPPVSPAPVVKLEYYAKGNFKKSIVAPDAGNFTTFHEYDRLDRRFRTTDARGKETGFAYNGREDLTQVTDPRALITRYPRNGLGDMTGLDSPDTGIAAHTLDEAGNIKTRRDSRGVLSTHTYDAANRLRSVVHAHATLPSQTVTWDYDQTGPGFSHGIGRLTSTQYPAGSTRYAHDPQGRVVSVTQSITADVNSIALRVGYGYDAAGRVVRITYPSGKVLHIPHSGGVPTALTLELPNSTVVPLIGALTLEPAVGGQGQARSWQWQLDSGPQAHERVFDLYGRMVRHPLGGAVRDITYDAADRIASYTHLNAASGAPVPALTQGFGYDELGRLKDVTTSLGSWTYGYDDNGNRTLLTQTTSAGIVSRNHSIDPGSNRLLAIDNPSRGFSHDAAGNTESDQQGWVGYRATHDASGRMSRVRASKDGRHFTTTVLAYDHAGQRVVKFPQVLEDCRSGPDNGCRAIFYPSPVVYVHDLQGRLLGEYDGRTGDARREYVWLQDMPLVIIDPGRFPAIYYVHTDHLNTPRTVIDRQGRQRWSWVAEPFGNSEPITDPVGSGEFVLNLRMPGQYFDNETGLSQNWHRELDHGLGRYVQSDPIGLAGGINTYSYVGGNPVSRVDPLGLWDKAAHDYFIDQVFGDLPGPLRDIVKEGSSYADAPRYQGPDYSGLHAMTSKSLSREQARQQMCKFMKDNFAAADRAKRSGDPRYLFYLGMGLHPAMDYTSPAHRGWQMWHGSSDALRHGPWLTSLETLSVAKQPGYTKETVDLMRRALAGDLTWCECQ